MEKSQEDAQVVEQSKTYSLPRSNQKGKEEGCFTELNFGFVCKITTRIALVIVTVQGPERYSCFTLPRSTLVSEVYDSSVNTRVVAILNCSVLEVLG